MSGYTEAVEDFRQRKDAHFAAGKGPLTGAALAEFRGLSYYPPDKAWTFTLLLDPPQPGKVTEFVLDTNNGQPRHMAHVGTVTVPCSTGEHSSTGEHTLSVFAPLGEEEPARVFIPFRDLTSGQDTYGAGRYLDAPVTRNADGAVWVEVDFNMAYHPYCAYGEGWTCPLPPAGNVLSVAVEAGEKLPS